MSLISSWGHINGGVAINKYRRDFERIASKHDARCRSKGLGNSIVRFAVTHSSGAQELGVQAIGYGRSKP